MSWNGIAGPIKRLTGTAGTATLPVGARVLQIKAYASAASTITVFDDASPITLPANSGWFLLQENHKELIARTGATTIVFASTAAYYIEYTMDGAM